MLRDGDLSPMTYGPESMATMAARIGMWRKMNPGVPCADMAK
jgi:hypothetical protein